MLSLMLELCQEGMASGSVWRRQMITATESRFCFLPLFPSVEAAVIVSRTPNVTRPKFRAPRNVNSRASVLDEETGASGFTLWRLLNTSSCLLVAESTFHDATNMPRNCLKRKRKQFYELFFDMGGLGPYGFNYNPHEIT